MNRDKLRNSIKYLDRIKVAKLFFSVGIAALLTLFFKVRAGAGINVSSLLELDNSVTDILNPIDFLSFLVIVAFVSFVSATLLVSRYKIRVPAVIGTFVTSLICGFGIIFGPAENIKFLILVLWGSLIYLSYIGLDILLWLYKWSTKDDNPQILVIKLTFLWGIIVFLLGKVFL